MKRRLFASVVIVVVFVVGYLIGQKQFSIVHAQTPDQQFTIPSSYGRCVGFLTHNGMDGLIFEATDGTIHLINMQNGHVVTIPRG